MGPLLVESLAIKNFASQNFNIFLYNLPCAIIISHIMLKWSTFRSVSPSTTSLNFLGSRNSALPTKQKTVMGVVADAYWMTNTFHLNYIQLHCADDFSGVYRTLSHIQSYLSFRKPLENDDYPQPIVLTLPSKYSLTWTTPHLVVDTYIISTLDHVTVTNLSSSPLAILVVCSPND